MTSAQVVETSVTNNSSFQNYPHPDDHTIRTTDTPGFKPFTMLIHYLVFQIQDGGGFFNQPGAELRIQDGGAHESRPCWKTNGGTEN